MASIAYHGSRVLRGIAAASLLATVVTGCVVTPEDNTWDNVGSFGWPTEIGATMHYKYSSRTMGTKDDSVTAEIRAGKAEFEGMYRLHTTFPTYETLVVNQIHFRPTADTLFVVNSMTPENGLSARYALVAPLDRGHTWVADYKTDANGVPTPAMSATIVERYSYWKLEGTGYQNVVAVKYTPVNTPPGEERQEWIRFYAQRIGLILTVKNRYPISSYPTAAAPEEDDRVVLTDTSVPH